MGIGITFERALHLLREQRRKFLPGVLGEFYRAGGNELILNDLPVSSDDLVLDVGGFQGSWTADILVRYGCRSAIFEPVPRFAAQMSRRFSRNSRVKVTPSGLSDCHKTVCMSLADDGSTAFPVATASGPYVEASMIDVADVFKNLSDPTVACMKINIEGGEYEVLPRMLSLGLYRRVQSLLIQFHRTSDDSVERLEAIAAGLSETHRPVFRYPFVWERWDLRE